MNGTSSFQEVRSSSSPSPSYPLLQEQRRQFETESRQLLHAYDLIARSKGISAKRKNVRDTSSCFQTFTSKIRREQCQL